MLSPVWLIKGNLSRCLHLSYRFHRQICDNSLPTERLKAVLEKNHAYGLLVEDTKKNKNPLVQLKYNDLQGKSKTKPYQSCRGSSQGRSSYDIKYMSLKTKKQCKKDLVKANREGKRLQL